MAIRNIEVNEVSKEIIKPSSSSLNHLKPYRLPLFNQLTPSTYVPVILFYPSTKDRNTTLTQLLPHLKSSLSQTLTHFYQFSGRVVDNLYVHEFDAGVPFLVARVSGVERLCDFLKSPDIQVLNRFLPRQPFGKESDSGNIPQVAFQVSVFPCGGVALGFVASHKLVDAPSASTFINAWASINKSGFLQDDMKPDFAQGSLFFPPKSDFPPERLSLIESLWFTKDEYVTRRFVFDAKSISLIREKGTGERDGKVMKPSRIEALTCFIWKACIAASRAASKTPKPSLVIEAVNLRTKTKPPMSKTSIGNIFWWATAIANSSLQNKELHNLSLSLNDAICLYDRDYVETLQGELGFETMEEYLSQLEGLFSDEKPDIFGFTSWCYTGITKVDFGWGEPHWVGIMGKAGLEFRNFTLFVETRDGKGIEAWITLDEERMKLLEHDPHFLAYASPNPTISCL